MTRAAEDGGQGLSERAAVKRIAAELGVSAVTVSVNLPYQSVVYKLEKKSKNAVRCGRYRKRKKAERNGTDLMASVAAGGEVVL